jgi:hypothetical protein
VEKAKEDHSEKKLFFKEKYIKMLLYKQFFLFFKYFEEGNELIRICAGKQDKSQKSGEASVPHSWAHHC